MSQNLGCVDVVILLNQFGL